MIASKPFAKATPRPRRRFHVLLFAEPMKTRSRRSPASQDDYEAARIDEREIYFMAYKKPDGTYLGRIETRRRDEAGREGAARHHAQLEHDREGGSAMITVFGSGSLDFIGTVSRIPKPGETVPGGMFSTAAGGKGANQSLAARRAGAEVRHVGAVGTDAFAAEAIALLEKDGVDLSALARRDGRDGHRDDLRRSARRERHRHSAGSQRQGVGRRCRCGARARSPKGSVLVLQQEIPQASTRPCAGDRAVARPGVDPQHRAVPRDDRRGCAARHHPRRQRDRVRAALRRQDRTARWADARLGGEAQADGDRDARAGRRARGDGGRQGGRRCRRSR